MGNLAAWLALAGAVVSGCSVDSVAECDDGKCDELGEFPEGAQYDRFRGFTQNVDGIPGILPANAELHPVYAELTEIERHGLAGWHLWSADGSFLRTILLLRKGEGNTLRALDSSRRATRFQDFGLLNDPGCRPASKPDRFGLLLDDCDDPYSSGAIGIRLKPNPKFDEAAWEAIGGAAGHLSDELFDVGGDKKPGWAIEPPYLPALTCTVCHAGPNPLRPPADIANPKWDEIVFAIGNQYLQEGAFAGRFLDEGDFARHATLSQPAGTSDTSKVASDHIHNPGAINAIANLPLRPRFVEELSPGADQPECDALPAEARAVLCARPACPDGDGVCTETYHILKDGADSSGPVGGLLRVFINVGACTPQMFGAIKAGKPISRRELHDSCAQYQDLEGRVTDMFAFLTSIEPYTLAEVDADALAACGDLCQVDAAAVDRGKLVFADQCATCHSSVQPDDPGFDAANPATWYTDARRTFFRAMVQDPAFPGNNFLSDDRRYPVTLIGTNASRSFATNAMRGKIWAEFSSETYKQLPPVAGVRMDLPGVVAGNAASVDAPAGGPGYYRTPSLLNLWHSAPFFHNNGLGQFTGAHDVRGRMEAFADATDKLFHPENRLGPASVRVTDRATQILAGNMSIPIPAGAPIDPFIYLGEALAAGAIKQTDLAGSLADVYQRLPQVLAPLDLVLDKGHTFAAGLSEQDKSDLVEFLKTL